jgi:cathepsin F
VKELRLAHPGAEFSLDESPFSHLSFKEFAATRLPKFPTGGKTGGKPAVTMKGAPAAPESFDWRTGPVKAVTSVKNQGAMGSCWVIPTNPASGPELPSLCAGVLLCGQCRRTACRGGDLQPAESVWLTPPPPQSKGSVLEDLSVEQLVECDDQVGTRSVDGEPFLVVTHTTLIAVISGSVNSDCGVFGGWPYLAYQYWMKAGGVRTEEEMPNCSGIDYGQPGCCLPCMVKGYNKTLCGNHNDLFCNASTTKGQGSQVHLPWGPRFAPSL